MQRCRTWYVTWLLQYDLYQYLLNVADDDCEKLLSCLTFLDYSEISAILREHFSAPESRLAQRVLAEYLVYLLRGFEGMREAKTVGDILVALCSTVKRSFKLSIIAGY
eukprot:gb/GECG01004291.1/.p1 GENE.gb/GECG01004291.1/~~gb/GECG01004291.1/.p1  ORF type:complete len:108 (+),score=6.68 gb/GECG01004291.1/:1-324(+)